VLEGLVQRLLADVLEEHGQVLRHHHFRDLAAHDAGSQHGGLLDLACPLAQLLREGLLGAPGEEEDADQVSRLRRQGQLRQRVGLDLQRTVHRQRVRALDHLQGPERRRVVAAGTLLGLPTGDGEEDLTPRERVLQQLLPPRLPVSGGRQVAAHQLVQELVHLPLPPSVRGHPVHQADSLRLPGGGGAAGED